MIAATLCASTVSLVYAAKTAKKGDLVQVSYVGHLNDGRIFDSTEGHSPIEFVIGDGKVLEDFENAIIGMKTKGSKNIQIPAARAYGAVDPGKLVKVPKSQIPEGAEPGAILNMRTPTGASAQVRFVESNGDGAYIDANHALAGKDLNFDLKLVAIKKAPKH